MIEDAIALALCALVLYGLDQVIAKAVVRSLDATSMVAVNLVVSLPIFVFIFAGAALLWGEYLTHLEYVLYGLIGASTARGGFYIYLEALERGAVSLVGSITAAYPALTALLAITFLGEKLGLLSYLGISMIIASMAALSFTHRDTTEGVTRFSRSSLLLSLATFLSWGVGAIFIKMALEGIPLISYLGLYVLVLPPIGFVYLRHKRASLRTLFPKWTVPIIGAIVVAELWQLAYFAETAAVSRGAASVVFPLISAYPVVTILGARAFLNERLSRPDLVILGIVILGIIMISVE
ncbi:MAG: DMT family transporter [Methanobacteriota archaeon]|nr:MAG: DMT family transporter [Euryarchaeota archaeon]